MGHEVATPATPQLAAGQVPRDLDLVVLFGSRARGTHGPSSDWDVGVCFHQAPEHPLRICALDPLLAQAMGCSSDAIDVVDLDQASYLLRRCVAEDGLPLFEREPGLFAAFCSRASRQWADWQHRQQKLNNERAHHKP